MFPGGDPFQPSSPGGTFGLSSTLDFRYYSIVTVAIALDMTSVAARERLAVLVAIADPIRWAVLESLGRSPKCVCEINESATVAPNLMSYHLKVLRDAGLVTTSRRGRRIDYALAVDAQERMRAALPGVREKVES
jgi:ArsR family transcriptional regulator, arsenate/arsenite/antimonite-responsive transcriptional repressor